MIILDENFPESQRQLLRGWRVSLRQIGYEVGRKGMQDEEILPFLRHRRRTTFFTLDLVLLSTSVVSCTVLLGMRRRRAVCGGGLCASLAASPAIRHRSQASGHRHSSVAARAGGVATPCRGRNPRRLVQLGAPGHSRRQSSAPCSGGYTKQGECMMSAFTVTLDCHSPETLAAFWGAALHYRVIHQGPQSVGLGPTARGHGRVALSSKGCRAQTGQESYAYGHPLVRPRRGPGALPPYGFLSLPSILVGALAGSDAGNPRWLGTASQDFMHFALMTRPALYTARAIVDPAPPDAAHGG